MLKMTLVCDECGKPATMSITGLTGRVEIDGIDNNLQVADFCDIHAPLSGAVQPTNCQHVRFVWGAKGPRILTTHKEWR